MRPINYQLTNGLINKIVKVEVLNAEIKDIELSDEITKKMNRDLMSNNIFHIAHILGLNLSLKDSERFIKTNHDGEDINYTVLTNYRDTLVLNRSNQNNEYVDLNSNYLTQINKILISNWKEEWEAKFRIDNNISTEFDNWVEYYDPTVMGPDVSKELANTYDWYKNNVTRINALIRIPVAFYRMLQIMPFSNLNKLSLIATTDFMLQKNGFLPKSLLSVAKLIDNKEMEYIKIWKEAINSPTGNITFWIEKFVEDISIELEANKKKIIKEKENSESSNPKPFLDLNKRQIKILRYLQTIPYVKREDYVDMFDVSTMTAFRDLSELLKKKILKIDGKGRATKYLLANK